MKSDRPFLEHIREEINFLSRETRSLQLDQLLADEILKRAVARSFEIIGEAVKNLSPEFKRSHPAVEWRKIAGLRDKLIHFYFGVDWGIVWDVIQNKLPELEKEIVKALEKPDPQAPLF